MIVALFLMLLGFGIYRHFTEPSIDNSRLAVFDRLLDGSFDSVMETFSQDGYVDHQIVGYGITEGDGTFYIKCSLSDSSNNHCSAIIYFCNNDGDYFFKCQYLDDHDFVPKGNYHELGVI